MEYPITAVARLAGTTSRTLRHYGDVGLLVPSRVGANGYRFYDGPALVRLQRILLLRSLGLPLPAIRAVLDDGGAVAPVSALRSHLDHLRGEQQRLDRQISAVLMTVEALERGEEPMPEKMFDGFDHTRYREEVEERWGSDAYAQGDAWWRGRTDEEREAFGREVAELNAGWADAATRGVAPTGGEAQELAGRHIAWLSSVPGVPRDDEGALLPEYVRGLGAMYVQDPRFAVNYGGPGGAGGARGLARSLLLTVGGGPSKTARWRRSTAHRSPYHEDHHEYLYPPRCGPCRDRSRRGGVHHLLQPGIRRREPAVPGGRDAVAGPGDRSCRARHRRLGSSGAVVGRVRRWGDTHQ